MSEMKKRLLVLASLVVVMVMMAGCSTTSIQTIGSEKYYVHITEDGEEYETGYEPRYEYNVDGYDQDGNKQTLSFTAGHLLKHDAYLRVFYKKKKDEVVYYEEVEKENVPKKALSELAK